MPVASPAYIAGPLTDRLNTLRVQRGSRIGLELDQIKFKALGLRNSDRASFLAVSGMIAALEQNSDDLLRSSRELEASYPERVGCPINVLRSLMALRLTDEASELAMRIVDRVNDVEDANVVAHCLVLTGSVGAARDVAAQFIQAYGNMDIAPVVELRSTLAMTEEFLASGFKDEDMRACFACARDSLLRQGWETPTLDLSAPLSDVSEGPVAICRFIVAVDESDDLIAVEEAVMDDLIAANDRVFNDTAIVLAVMPHVAAA